MRSRQTLPVGIELDRDSTTSLRDQLIAELTQTIDSLLLPGGTRMPSTRTLAEALGVSRSVAVAAYELLLARGYLEIRPGSGTYVARPGRQAPSRPTAPARQVPDKQVPKSLPDAPAPVDLRAGRAPRDGFPVSAWRSAWRSACHKPWTDWLPDLGLPELRRELRCQFEARHWRSLAGHEVVAAADLRCALRVLLGALATTGRVGVAQLTPAVLHSAVSASGLPVAAIPVDDEGPMPGGIPLDVRVVVVPDEAYVPGGRPPSVARRQALADWSARTGGYLIEASLYGGALAAAAPSLLTFAPQARVCALGSFTSLLGSELPAAYLVVPAEHSDAVGQLLAAHDARPPAIAQDVLRRLLADGVVGRRITALRRQRATVVGTPVARAFAHVPGVAVTGPTLDGTIVAWLPPGSDAVGLAAVARVNGVLVSTVDSVLFGATRDGIVVDLGHVDEVTAHRALRTLSALCAGATHHRELAV